MSFATEALKARIAELEAEAKRNRERYHAALEMGMEQEAQCAAMRAALEKHRAAIDFAESEGWDGGSDMKDRFFAALQAAHESLSSDAGARVLAVVVAAEVLRKDGWTMMRENALYEALAELDEPPCK